MLPPYMEELRRQLSAAEHPAAKAFVKELDTVAARLPAPLKPPQGTGAEKLEVGKILRELHTAQLGGFDPLARAHTCPKCGHQF